MKLKHKSLLSFFSALFIINSTVVCYYSFLLVQRGLFRHKQVLKGIAYQAKALIQEEEHTPIHRLHHDIKDGIRFANNGKPIDYMIIHGDDQRITNNEQLIVPESQKHRKFNWAIVDFSTCRFEYILKKDGFTVYLTEVVHHEFFQDIFEGIAITFIMISLLAFYFSKTTSQRTISSLEDIAEGVTKVKSGMLGARIPTTSKEHTELIELKEHLNQVFFWLEDFHSRTSNFSAEMAHEMRTPLTSILGSLEVALRHKRTTEEYQVVIAETMQDIKKLHNLIEDMLLMVKPQVVFEELFESCSLSEISTEVTSQMKILTESLEISLKTEIGPHVLLEGIPSLFQRLIYNLIGNATKFTPAGGTIQVSLTKDESEIKLVVADSGIGIDADQLKHIFERFYRGNNKQKKGAGLGLSICKWVVELTGGEIGAVSRINEGTTITASWPLNGSNRTSEV